ncbi:hypothetical protein [Lactiplantibacillus carotarum]|uniref:hypothetical protein n=1 Tax=Lactiplantibacillus carotarum TaxID=2993456 RepID=UPI00298ED4B7|nr:hypothetical protein [Lactiplantibacillus carotarum]
MKSAVADGGVVDLQASFAVQTYVQWLNLAEQLAADPAKMATNQQLIELSNRITKMHQLSSLNNL